jgi:hypothetical protein
MSKILADDFIGRWGDGSTTDKRGTVEKPIRTVRTNTPQTTARTAHYLRNTPMHALITIFKLKRSCVEKLWVSSEIVRLLSQ